LRQSQNQLRAVFSVHLKEHLELEKNYLAAEIHDELGQMLTALKIDLAWLAKRLSPEQEPLLQKTQSMMKLITETDRW
jgi:two-component system sensor histidine kinase UhpB